MRTPSTCGWTRSAAASGETGALFMMGAFMMAGPSGDSLASLGKPAVAALEKDDNELFFRIMRKVTYLSHQEDMRIRDVMRSYTLTQIDAMVKNDDVAKGVEGYPHTDDEEDGGGSNPDDYWTSEILHWNEERGFGYIQNPYCTGPDVFFHISEFYTDKHTPSVGDKVQFLIVYNEGKDRNEAHDVHDEKSCEFDNDDA